MSWYKAEVSCLRNVFDDGAKTDGWGSLGPNRVNGRSFIDRLCSVDERGANRLTGQSAVADNANGGGGDDNNKDDALNPTGG